MARLARLCICLVSSILLSYSLADFVDRSCLCNRTILSSEELVTKYGNDGFISRLELLRLLKDLGNAVTSLEITSGQPCERTNASCTPTRWECTGLDDLFEEYGKDGGLNNNALVSVFPSLVTKLTSENCEDEIQPDSHGHNLGSGQVWGYGIGFVTLICVVSNIGGLLGPCMETECFQQLLLFLVAIAVGTLAATGLLVLIPEAFNIMSCEEQGEHYLWKGAIVLLAIYIFFTSERLLKIIFHNRKVTEMKKASNYHVEADSPLTQNHGHSHVDPAPGGVATVAWMVLIGDALHNFVDGLSIGAAFTENIYTGISVSIAVVCEELPHELGDIAILLHSGFSIKKALLYNFVAALVCYFGLIIGILLGENTAANRWIFAFAGGLFLYVSLVDMLSEMTASLNKKMETGSSVWSMVALQTVGLLIGSSIILVVANFASKINLQA